MLENDQDNATMTGGSDLTKQYFTELMLKNK